MKIARVFPTKTSMTPIDSDAYFCSPDLFTPFYDEIHISVTFTWDIERGNYLYKQWRNHGKIIKIGGCAFDDPGEDFISGMYLKKGITITSRGCPYSCFFCFVPKREGKIKELNIKPGNIIQDNNFLACSKKHRQKVYSMLKRQKAIEFKGGLHSRLLTDWDIEQIRGLRIKELWFACDFPDQLISLGRLYNKLKIFPSYKKRCYVIIGFNKAEEELRLKQIYKYGFYPFAQLYKDGTDKKYSKDWKQFARTWSRPAAYKSLMKSTTAVGT